MEVRTLADAVEDLARRGYADGFRAEGEGLRHLPSGRVIPAEALCVDEMARFEGESNPDDEALVLAVRSADGRVRGTWTVAFGPGMDPLDGELARRLVDARQEP
jgi:hypothetical protein